MIIQTQEFKKVINKILIATEVDKKATANLELFTRNSKLYLNVSNSIDYYVAIKFTLAEHEDLHATVDAATFLSLINGLTAETFSLSVKDNTLFVKADKSKYKIALIYDNDKLMTLAPIALVNKTVSMPIANDILQSILNVNSKELLKTKNIDVSELQKLYYIDETGAFTFTTGACLNSFTLDKPVKMLLSDHIVKLFKLFDEDVQFSFGYDQLENNSIQTKVIFETSDVYVAAIITSDDNLIAKVQGPCLATKNYVKLSYSNHLVLSVSKVSAALNRIISFCKNTNKELNGLNIPATIVLHKDEIEIIDMLDNVETVTVENDSYVNDGYSMRVNLIDLKVIFDFCKEDYVTLNCGNHHSVVITRGQVSNLISELNTDSEED